MLLYAIQTYLIHFAETSSITLTHTYSLQYCPSHSQGTLFTCVLIFKYASYFFYFERVSRLRECKFALKAWVYAACMFHKCHRVFFLVHFLKRLKVVNAFMIEILIFHILKYYYFIILINLLS